MVDGRQRRAKSRIECRFSARVIEGVAVDYQVAIIDDSELLCTALLRFMGAAGFSALAFPSAEAFLASGSLGRVGCLLLDVQMPGMSGLELQQRLRQLRCPVPIVFMTALDRPALRRTLLAAGAHRVLRKPATDEEIIDALRSALDASPGA